MTASSTDGKPVALLDACVLVPIRLTTTLLWLAEDGLFEPLWSDRILGEVQRNLPRLGVDAERAARRVAAMRRAFGAAALVDRFDELIPTMTCDAKDRHVLAAAVAGGADALITFNLKDFPPASTDPHRVEVLHPDPFLTRLLAERRPEVIAALERGTATLHTPPHALRQFLTSLTPTVPSFARLATDPTDPA